jgi:hypothetical protein
MSTSRPDVIYAKHDARQYCRAALCDDDCVKILKAVGVASPLNSGEMSAVVVNCIDYRLVACGECLRQLSRDLRYNY